MRRYLFALLAVLLFAVALVVSSACKSSNASPSGPSPVPNPSEPTRIISLEIRITDGSLLGRPIPPEGVAMGQGVEVTLIFSVPEAGRVVRSSIEVTSVSGLPYTESSEIRASDMGERGFGLNYWPGTTGEHKVIATLAERLGTQSRQGMFVVR